MDRADAGPVDIEPSRVVDSTLVREIELHESLGSTNDRALVLASQGLATPLLVVARRQSSGVRGSNQWWAAPGALTWSLLLNRAAGDLGDRQWRNLSLLTGLAVGTSLRELLPEHTIRLKWPNDVFLAAKKVCGILVETTSHRPDMIVLGVGLNVNNRFAAAPMELRGKASSLSDETGQTFDGTDVLIRLLQQLETVFSEADSQDFSLAERWREHCLLEGRTVCVEAGSHRLSGVCQGIDDEGALLLQNETGIQRCYAGVVTSIL